jgi:hypothetical protein
MDLYLSSIQTLAISHLFSKQETGWRRYQSHHFAARQQVEQVSNLFRLDVLLDCHVSEFAGLKDVAAFLAFNKFSVFVAGHYAHTRMPADFLHNSFVGGSLRG